jgi:hypothetical protein
LAITASEREENDMPLTPAICTNCGGSVKVDSSTEAAVCKFCHTPFIVEKAINEYNIQNATIHADVVYQGDNPTALNDRAAQFLEDSDWYNAQSTVQKVLNIDPKNGAAWVTSLLVEAQVKTIAELKRNGRKISTYKSGNRALQYAVTEQKRQLLSVDEKIQKLQDAKRNDLQQRLNDFNIQINELNPKIASRHSKSKWVSRVCLLLSFAVAVLGSILIFNVFGIEKMLENNTGTDTRSVVRIIMYVLCAIPGFLLGSAVFGNIMKSAEKNPSEIQQGELATKAKKLESEIANIPNGTFDPQPFDEGDED